MLIIPGLIPPPTTITTSASSDPSERDPALKDINEDNFVQYTSVVTAYLRALESCREDKIIDDPFAKSLAGEMGEKLVAFVNKWSNEVDKAVNFMAVRTKFLDEAIDRRPSVIQQVVILAAGLDTRPYRLSSLKEAKVFEIDYASELQKKKIDLLQNELKATPQAKQIDYLTADLLQDNWNEMLLVRGFDPKVPTFWCLEGLAYYLNQNGNLKLLKTIDSMSAPKSQFWVDLCGHGAIEETDLAISLFLKYGEDDPLNDGILTMLNWELILQAKIDKTHNSYYGRECDPFLGVTTTSSSPGGKPMDIPWFFIRGTKPHGEKTLAIM